MTQWAYDRASGTLSRDGKEIGRGYAGHGPGLNNPAAEQQQSVGPLPAGTYAIGPWATRPHLGPVTAPLEPIQGDMFGRGGFFIHGDTAAMDHSASDGCIILARPLREAVRDSGDRVLIVV